MARHFPTINNLQKERYTTAAIEAYNKLLEQNPDNDYIKSQLEWLKIQ